MKQNRTIIALGVLLLISAGLNIYQGRRIGELYGLVVATEQKLVTLRGRVQVANAGLMEISKQLTGWAAACRVWPYPAISVTLASALKANARMIPLLTNYEEASKQ